MDSPYHPPVPETIASTAKLRFWKRSIIVSAALIILPPMLGLTGTVIGMIGAFGELSKSGSADPAALAGYISTAMLTTLWGLVFSVIGVILLIISIIRLRQCRAPLSQGGSLPPFSSTTKSS